MTVVLVHTGIATNLSKAHRIQEIIFSKLRRSALLRCETCAVLQLSNTAVVSQQVLKRYSVKSIKHCLPCRFRVLPRLLSRPDILHFLDLGDLHLLAYTRKNFKNTEPYLPFHNCKHDAACPRVMSLLHKKAPLEEGYQEEPSSIYAIEQDGGLESCLSYWVV